ncbi:MAG: sigma-70 family RNA polymerase sigma factor [Acidobacteriota bacterium]
MVYRHFEQPLLRLGLRMLSQQQDAEDALQITFLKLYRSLQNFRFDSNFGTYLFRIMVNVCFDIRKTRKFQKVELDEATLPAFQVNHDLQIQLEQAIRVLPERMRVCFILFAIEAAKCIQNMM